MKRIRIGIVGLGKIALEEHVPALLANRAYELVASASVGRKLDGALSYSSIDEMLDECPALDAVSICTPPQSHHMAAKAALLRGKHVLLEKPPCATTDEFDELVALASRNKCTLFQSWHTRESTGVDVAAGWLAGRDFRRGRVVWKEDVRQWHPGQEWIWRENGFGVLDAGINAISILTKIIPDSISVEHAHLLVPANCASPIAATAVFRTGRGALIEAEFDFRDRRALARSIELETDAGTLRLVGHGETSVTPDSIVNLGSQHREYEALYRRFALLIGKRESDTDKRPLQLVLDILSQARRTIVTPFEH